NVIGCEPEIEYVFSPPVVAYAATPLIATDYHLLARPDLSALVDATFEPGGQHLANHAVDLRKLFEPVIRNDVGFVDRAAVVECDFQAEAGVSRGPRDRPEHPPP